MGNSWQCCGQKSPCDHTEDETQGLLPNSESKTSTKAGTEIATSPTSDEKERHKEEIKPESDELVVTKQPSPEAETLKAQSCYSTTIPILHTDVSLAAEVNHNSSPETKVLLTEAPTEVRSSAIETRETKTEVVQETQNITAEVSEIPRETAETPAEVVAAQLKAEKEAVKKVDDAAVSIDDTGATSQNLAVAPAEETPVPKTSTVAQVDAAKNLKEPETKVDISDETETSQAEELSPNVTPDVKHEEVSLILNDKGDVSVIENSSTEGDELGQSNDLNVNETSITEVTSEEPTVESTAEVEEKSSADTHSEMAEPKDEISETQEHSKQVSSPVVSITNGLPTSIENGLVMVSNNLKNENVTAVDEVPQKGDTVPNLREEPSYIENEQPTSKLSTNIDSTNDVKPEVKDSVTDQEKIEKVTVQEQEETEPTQNGLDSTSTFVPSSPDQKIKPTESASDSFPVEDTEIKGEVTVLRDEVVQDEAMAEPQRREEAKDKQEEEKKENEQEEEKDKQKEKQEEEKEKQEEEKEKQEEEKEKQEKEASVAQENEEKEDTESSATQKREIIFSSDKVEVELVSGSKTRGNVEEVLDNEDESENLYLGAEEMGATQEKPSKPLLELTIPGVEVRCSLAAAVDILTYSEREWKGNTAKSALIRKGYSEMSRSFSGLRRVRGDNYCALRATLYQVLATSTNLPTWLQDEGLLLLPEIIEAREHLIGGWVFPPECKWGSEEKDSVERLKHYLDLLKKKWQAAVSCESSEERQSLCEQVFLSGEEEYGLLEALKFLMLAKAIELHGNMLADQEVPVFCWLLFARDTSENPKTLLTNHLSQIGFSGGVEQVEMFLLGYALQHTIQAFRLYMTDTEEFVTHYPDDHKSEWPCVCIVTEDDRHYNVPVRNTVKHQQRDENEDLGEQ